MSSPIRTLSLALAAACLLPVAAVASQPAIWHYADENDFRRGNLDGLALHPTTGLTPAPSLQRIDVDAEFVHSWVRDGQKLWLGTGLLGKVFVVENGKAREVAKVDAPMVASLLPDGSGGVYAGLVGSGEIVRVAADGKVTPFVKLTDVNHVWAMVRRGNELLAGTGPGGKVFAIDLTTQKAREYADTGAEHVLVLGLDGNALIAGTAEPAMLMRIEGEKQVKAIASFPGNEVRSLVRADKAWYVAVNGAATAVPLASMKPTSERPGKDPADRPSAEKKPGKDPGAKGRGAVWKRSDDGIVSRVFLSPEGMLSQIGVSGRTVVAGAARGGRVVVGDDFGDVQSLFDLNEEEVLGLEMGPKGAQTLFTGKSAAVYVVGAGQPKPAVFTTEVMGETGPAQWGLVEAIGEGSLVVESRSGFSDPPSETWSAWTPATDSILQSPPATFLQVRVKLASPDARLTELKISRQVVNRPPLVLKIDTVFNKAKRTIAASWVAEDPDGDALAFVVQYRLRGTKQWLKMHDRLFPLKAMEIAPTDMPDGWYELRVEVTDEPANGPAGARATARISKPFLVDQGRPEVTAQVVGTQLQGMATDAISKIVRVEVSLDGEPPVLAAARDGLFDRNREAFDLDLPAEAAKGPHTLLIQVTDESGNTAALRLPFGQ